MEFLAPGISIPSFFHWYDVPPLVESNCEPPEQMVAEAGAIDGLIELEKLITASLEAAAVHLSFVI